MSPPIIPIITALVLGVLFGRHVTRIDHPAVILGSGLILSLMLGSLPFYGIHQGGMLFSLSLVYLSALVGVVLGSETRGGR